MARQKYFKIEETREYQDAFLFNRTFQKSKKCIDLRKAWGISETGFQTQQDFEIWNAKFINWTNIYYKSKDYAESRSKIREMKTKEINGEITNLDFKLFALRMSLKVPMHKFKDDIDCLTPELHKPIYWRDFIEQCILFSSPIIIGVMHKEPEPRLVWDSISKTYSMIIDNIFSDTTLEDFKSLDFSEKFKELQKQLPGFQVHKTRKKPTLMFMSKLKELDEQGVLSDYEKADKIYGETENNGTLETKRRNALKQTRNRIKKNLK